MFSSSTAAAAAFACLAALSAQVRAHPGSFNGDVTKAVPGGAFGNMGIANYEATPSEACEITHDIPDVGFTIGTKYTFTISTNADYKTGLGMVYKVGSQQETVSMGKSKAFAWTGAGDAISAFAICGAGGSYRKLHAAESVTAKKAAKLVVVGGCAGTQHGCCDDQNTAKTDKDGANCAENQQTVGGPCTTEHGCCDDKQTAKTDKDGANCAENQKKGGCAGTEHGCCDDQKTAKTDKDGANCAEIQGGYATVAPVVTGNSSTVAPVVTGDKCKGFGTLADMSLAAPDGELVDADMEKKGATDNDFLSAVLALRAQIKKCESDAACPAAGQCVKAGTDCEPDFIPFMKVTKCGASVIAKTTKAFNRAKAAEAKTAKAEVATAKAAVTSAKAKKAAADEAAAACGDTCAPEVKAAATIAASAYEAAQRTETEAATKASNKAASASNAADAATKADAEIASTVAPVVTGNASTVAPVVTGAASTTAPGDASAVAKAAAAAAAKAYTDAGCDTDPAKDGCAVLAKDKAAADAKVADLAEDSGASGLAASIAAVLVGAIAAVSF